MGKKGPCFHCGTHSTPLWRKGPPEKPVLCNACGSRHRLGKSLEDYVPKAKPNNKNIFKKRSVVSSSSSYYAITNRISYVNIYLSDDSPSYSSSSDSPVLLPQNHEDEGKTRRSIRRGGSFPSKKRSLVAYRELTAIERLQKELRRIKTSDPSILYGIEENPLIYTNKTNPYASQNEIGLGIVLLPPKYSHSSI